MKSSPLARAKELVVRGFARLMRKEPALAASPVVNGRSEVHDGQNTGLIEDCVTLLVELEDLTLKVDQTVRPAIEHVLARLTEILERAGLERIENEVSFDVARHQVFPPTRVAPGTPILETLTPGLVLGLRVLKRAKVRVK
jgi:molecular chaperone GrpE (heat shock protein)